MEIWLVSFIGGLIGAVFGAKASAGSKPLILPLLFSRQRLAALRKC